MYSKNTGIFMYVRVRVRLRSCAYEYARGVCVRDPSRNIFFSLGDRGKKLLRKFSFFFDRKGCASYLLQIFSYCFPPAFYFF